MMEESELKLITESNVAGSLVCACYLSCIFQQQQLGRPLSEDEIEEARCAARLEYLQQMQSVEALLRQQASLRLAFADEE